MKAVGVIVEYNPFHNGHFYHLTEALKLSEADCAIAVMSGNFLQRGEPALVSKWTRTKMALEAGIDIVIELPYLFATQKAETFANGAISILDAMNCDEVCFGSEHGSISDFKETVHFMGEHSNEFDRSVQTFIKKGYSFPKASSLAYYQLNDNNTYLDLSKPNNILGYHYVKAINDQQSQLKPSTIIRTGSNYHDEEFTSTHIASATSIRKHLFNNASELEDIVQYVPSSTARHLISYKSKYGLFHEWENYFVWLKYKILTSSLSELKEIYEVEEGLENRLKSVIRSANCFQDFMHLLKTKRYTWTRLQRMCTHILTNTTKEQMQTEKEQASYIRLLGMSNKGQNYLSTTKKQVDLPIISRLGSKHDDILNLDIKASNTYAMAIQEPLRNQFIQAEYSTPPIRYNELTQTFSH
ncbi:nucleotidyltransferase [Bacillus timonensis]|nr:nucleotidyltransferase [Bacillus timonensis]